jgi:hypothetical protein
MDNTIQSQEKSGEEIIKRISSVELDFVFMSSHKQKDKPNGIRVTLCAEKERERSNHALVIACFPVIFRFSKWQ